MRRITLSFAACPAVQYISTVSQKGNIFENEVIGHKTSVLILSTIFA
jgi:hypothetical protein